MEVSEMENLVETKVKEVLASNNNELLRSIGGMIDKISSTSSTPAVNASAEKPIFKRKSNEEQFKHNSKVMMKLEEATCHIGADNIEKARESIIEAKDIVKRRQKLVQLADTSELGWKVVAEYEVNPIASDSEDERRIYKAEAQASRKAKSEKSKRSKTRGWPYSYRKPGQSTDSTATSSSQRSIPQAGGRGRSGLCFTCGLPGHWKAECGQNRQSNNKISVFDCLSCEEKGESLSNSNTSRDKHASSIGCSQVATNMICANVAENVRAVEKPDVAPSVSPVGRLKQSVEKWKEITDDIYILDVIQNGYKLPLKEIPPRVQLRNNKSARDNSMFVGEEIQALLYKGVISEVNEKPWVVNPLTVAFSKSGKPRLVLDCRHINPYLHVFRIKFEDIHTALHMFDVSNYVFTYDLKSAYHHIDIFEHNRTYLGFSWPIGSDIKYYVYNSLPFGIRTAGHIFTKTLKCVVKYFRALGHRVIMFLDDGIGGHVDRRRALLTSKFVHQSLCSLGFLIADEKCNWIPSTTAVWLGHALAFQSNLLFISCQRIERLVMALQSMIFQLKIDSIMVVSVRHLASVVGQVVSLMSVVGRVVCRKTRYLYKCILSRKHWNSVVHVSDEALAELDFWKDNVRVMNATGRAWRESSTVDFNVYFDASAVGYGGFVEGCRPVEHRLESTEIHGFSREVSERYSLDHIDGLCDVSGTGDNDVAYMAGNMTNIYDEHVEVSDLDEFSRFSVVFQDVLCSTVPPEVGHSSQMFPEVRVGLEALPEESVDDSVLPIVSKKHSALRTMRVDQTALPEVSAGCWSLPEVSVSQLDSANASIKSAESCCLVLPEASSGQVKSDAIRYDSTEVIGCWTEIESVQSSTWRGLQAMYRVLLSSLKILTGKRVKFFTDNRNICYIFLSGSNVDSLHGTCLNIHHVCEMNSIRCSIGWIPRSGNTRADYLSRCLDSDDWSVSDTIFNHLDSIWGPFIVDRFSSHYNNKCARFNSKYWVPGTEAVNCFEQCWSSECNWLVPPPALIAQCLQKMIYDKATAR